MRSQWCEASNAHIIISVPILGPIRFRNMKGITAKGGHIYPVPVCV